MKKKVLKNLIKVALAIKEGTKVLKNNIVHVVTITAVSAVIVGGVVWAMGADERAEKKEAQIAMQKEIAYEQDKNLAAINEAEVARRAIQNAEKAQELIELKGEFATLTVTTECTPELTTEHTSKLGKLWSRNVLRITIPYTIKYMVALDNMTSFVGEDGTLYMVIDEKDFNAFISAGQYVKITPEEGETGWFAREFTDRETLALLNSNLSSVSEKYSKDTEKIRQAVENAKEIIQTIADTMEVNVRFIENKSITNISFTTEIESGEEVINEVGDK